MNRRGIAAAVLAFALAAAPAAADSWTGWITVERCGAAGANAEHKDCAEKCHKSGIPLAFYNDADQKVYKIDDQKAAVCVVGAGIAGLTTAYLLAKAGRKVVVLDAGTGGGGETPYTTAHLASAIDDRYAEVERIRGTDVARLAAQSHGAAIDRIETIIEDEDIDCHFRRVDGRVSSSFGGGSAWANSTASLMRFGSPGPA